MVAPLWSRFGERAAINMVIVDEACAAAASATPHGFRLESKAGGAAGGNLRNCLSQSLASADGRHSPTSGIATPTAPHDEVEWATLDDRAECAAMDGASGLDRRARFSLLFERAGRVLRRSGGHRFCRLRAFGRVRS